MDKMSGKPTIMLVDDTPANLKVLQEILQAKSYRVVAFTNGKLALSAAKSNPPSLILLDINMPEMNGFEVCDQLKADDALKDIPVIFLSAVTETTKKVKAFSSGGVDFITKPFQIEEVLARVETHLNLRRLREELEKHNSHLGELVKEKVAEITSANIATTVAVAKLAEYRDDETGRHIDRTRVYCKVLAEKLRKNPRYAGSITEKFIENIFYAAPLHDIGKVGVPDAILLKPGKLIPEEFEIMKTHAAMGSKALQAAHKEYAKNTFLNMGIAIARSHHEKWDGSGYPDGLAGEDIPLSARIMSIADVYDALRSRRPYKSSFTHEKTSEIIMGGTGWLFDPAVVEAFGTLERDFNDIHAKMSGVDA